MAGRIQTNPAGLLNLLGLKTTGQNPALFPDHVQGTIELGNRYALQSLRIERATAQMNNGDPGDNYVRLTVPSGELWTVLWCSALMLQAAGTSSRSGFGMELNRSGGTPLVWLSDNTAQSPGASPPDFYQLVRQVQFPNGFLLPPGASIFFSVWENSGLGTTAVGVTFTALITSTPV